jgi:D-3-phosphoglycerate dehydrogenase
MHQQGRPRILVTPRSLTGGVHPDLAPLRAAGFEIVTATPGQLPSEAELIRLVPDCVGWLAGIEPVSAAVIAAAARLKVVSRNGTGIDNLPVEDLRRRGITIATAGAANAPGVAELALALILAGLRHVAFSDRGIRDGSWPRRRGRELRDRKVAVIGCGAIGGEAARLLVALGAEVLGYDPQPRDLGLAPDRFRWAELDAALAEADIITLHCPLQPGGTPLLDARRLARLRPQAIIVNTSRAGLIDEAAMLAALESGAVEAYATDVYAEEPPRDLALAGHERVISTSHIGGFTDESVARATRIAVDNLLAVLGPAVADAG